MLLFQYRIYRSDLELNPHVIYCFGDNDEKVGKGGQAKECRGEPNALGIPTKKGPGINDDCYYYDSEYDENIRKIERAFTALEIELKKGTVVVLPTEGFGTGLAMLKVNAPRTLAYIEERVLGLVEKYGDT